MLNTIKRYLCLVLVLSFALFLSACKDGTADTESVSKVQAKEENEQVDMNAYKDIERKTSKGLSLRYFSFDDKDIFALSVLMPIEWTISEDTEGYSIVRDGENIGTIKLGKTAALPNETVCESETNANDGVSCEWSIVYGGEEFIHRFVYSCEISEKERSMTFEVEYDELDMTALKKAKYSMALRQTMTDAGLGTIDISARPGEKPILILGNSFVGTSCVGEIFARMCEASSNHKYDVVWEAQGMATVSQNWSECAQSMRDGAYAAVFMCGFYGQGDVAAFGDFVDICKASNTPIVIFPAHNESTASNAVRMYPDAYYLDWKGELNLLISLGVDRWDLCIDDYYDHSTPLAGYVGAHMIYRALFGEMPPVINKYNADVSYDLVVKKLGDYAQTGTLKLIKDDVAVYSLK